MAACQPFVYRDSAPKPISNRAGESGRAAHQIEALTEAFQLAYGSQHAALRSTSTLGALEALGRARLLPEQVCRELDHAYVFLRTAEHRQQLGLADADMDRQVEASRARVRELCDTVGRLAS